MTDIFAITLCVVLACLAVFQLALIMGAPIGQFAWGGQHTVLPRNLRIGSVTSIILYAVFAAIITDYAGLATVLPSGVSSVGIWVLTVYFFTGIPLNAVSRSKPERMLMTPLVTLLAVLSLLTALKI